jgi:hypothetical protein
MSDPLLDELAQAVAKPDGKTCGACAVVATLSPERQEAVVAALSGNIGHERLAAIFQRNGVPIGRQLVRNHRQGKGHSE